MTVGGCFEYRVKALGWLKKLEKKKEMNSSDLLTVSDLAL